MGIKKVCIAAIGFCVALVLPLLAVAQEAGLQPGEAYATRFSGITTTEDPGVPPATVIDLEGVVGSIVDVRHPETAPTGHHWRDEPQRIPVTAGEVGQVFGIAIDDNDPPNVYLTATAAFGLHRNADNSDWMEGMWGPEGGPGTVYKLNAEKGYAPEVFANITLDGRENSGAALGNIAFDPWNNQLYVSDLETGMIHRLSVPEGTDLGYYDHGVDGRSNFYDALFAENDSLPAQPFDPSTSADIDDCADPENPALPSEFARTPSCWNVADFRRRIWGLGVYRDDATDKVRLFYAVWGSASLGNPEWDEATDDRANSVWSVGIGPDGGFDLEDIRREFFLPRFFTRVEDLARAGESNPVSDIAFSADGVMLLAERGGLRNLGLDAEEPFSPPHESRVLRYGLDENGIWQPLGRYDVGFADRSEVAEPYIRANGAGGVDFGFGYTGEWVIDFGKPDQFVWMSGDALCSPEGPCFDPATGEQTDTDQVHGLQGTPEDATEEIIDPDAGEPDAEGADTADGPGRSYMIDLDLNVDEDGELIPAERDRNDATKIGDVEIYEPVGATQAGPPGYPVHSVQLSAFHRKYESAYHDRVNSAPFHSKAQSHSKYGSHSKTWSHYKFKSHEKLRSHAKYASHEKYESHYKFWSHHKIESHGKYGSHYTEQSHSKYGSHDKLKSHYKLWSHQKAKSHWKYGSHNKTWSHYKAGSHEKIKSHAKYGSHNKAESHYKFWSHFKSVSHNKYGSHDKGESHSKFGSHNKVLSHYKTGSHDKLQSHAKYGSHNKAKSHYKLWSHSKTLSHAKYGSHNKIQSHQKTGSHSKTLSHYKTGSHDKLQSHAKYGSHNKTKSHYKLWSHSKTLSHAKYGSHNKSQSHQKFGSHSKQQSHAKYGSHNKKLSHAKTGSHDKKLSHAKYGSHNKVISHAKTGSHSKTQSHYKTGSHNKKQSHAKTGSHTKQKSHAKTGSHSKTKSHWKTGSHNKKQSHAKIGSHTKQKSHAKTGSHNKLQSHLKKGSHSKQKSHAKTGSHSKQKSHAKTGSHNKVQSHLKKGSHNKQKSHAKTGSHNKVQSHLKKGSHNKQKSHAKTGSHNKVQSHLKKGSHNKQKSHAKTGSHNKLQSQLNSRPQDNRLNLQLR